MLFGRFKTIYTDGIKRFDTAILYISLVDFIMVVAIIVLYTASSPLPVAVTYLSILEGLHAFSWMVGICAYVVPYSFALIRAAFIGYFLCGLLDFISLCVRLFLTSAHTGTAGQGGMYIVIVWFIVDTVQLLLLVMVMGNVKSHKQKVLETVTEEGNVTGVQNAAQQWLKVPDDMEDACSSMRLMAMVDVFASIVLIVFLALGLGVNSTFIWLYYAQAFHLFIWVMDYTMSEAPGDSAFSNVLNILLGLDFAGCIGTNVYRLYLIFQCYQPGGTSTDCLVLSVFSWIVVFLVFGLAIVDGLSLFFMVRIRHSSERLTEDLDANIAQHFKARRRPEQPQDTTRYTPSRAIPISTSDYRPDKYD